MRLWSYVLSGALFGAGLILASMTNPQKVQGFLDWFGDFDPSLMFVLVAAILVHAPAQRWIAGRGSPYFALEIQLPTRRDVDRDLILGSTLFGVGWGLVGYCPGPALTALSRLDPAAFVFVSFMLLGMLAHYAWRTAKPTVRKARELLAPTPIPEQTMDLLGKSPAD
jgi:uncharacterized protein